ncbi:MAG: hypothetical protein SP1CHLAM54_06960 [Chlamydiia bacterium]|nr:hypothetical protein [Chlamydiia bacterium]MCH9615602.1 hypothetical protein [Chlamydiia bacterium]MCH9628995.1 hypothetical protein [Chlamydiia bacterium]
MMYPTFTPIASLQEVENRRDLLRTLDAHLAENQQVEEPDLLLPSIATLKVVVINSEGVTDDEHLVLSHECNMIEVALCITTAARLAEDEDVKLYSKGLSYLYAVALRAGEIALCDQVSDLFLLGVLTQDWEQLVPACMQLTSLLERV